MNIEFVRQFGWILGKEDELGIVRVKHSDKDRNVFRLIFFGLSFPLGRNSDDQSFDLDLINLPWLTPNGRDAGMGRKFFDGDQRRNVSASVFAKCQATALDSQTWEQRDMELFEINVAVEFFLKHRNGLCVEVRISVAQADGDQNSADDRQYDQSDQRVFDPWLHGRRSRS